MFNKFLNGCFSMIILAFVLTACGINEQVRTQNSSPSSSAPNTEAAPETNATPVTQVTLWFAEPEHGGQYAALEKGFYKEAGLDMTIQPGGPQVSTIPLVASGKVDFGMATADDLLVARDQGIPIVAIAAIFQTNPFAFIAHKGQNIQSFEQINGRTVFLTPSSNYWSFLEKKYNLNDVKKMSYTGTFASFISDPESIIQGFITSEPFALKEQGIETTTLLNADSGFNPYSNILFTTERMIREKPDVVEAFVRASIKGWDYYQKNSEEIHKVIQKWNPDLSMKFIEYGYQAEQEFIWGGDAATHGVGYMSDERWKTLYDQMKKSGILKNEFDVNQAYTTQFLPAA